MDIDFVRVATDHHPALFRLAYRLTRSTERAHDLVQDTLERTLRKRPQLSSQRDTRAWLMKVMRNHFLDLVRREQAQRRVLAALREATPPAADEPRPESTWKSFDRWDVEACLGALDDKLRAPFELHVLGDKSYQEISRVLKIPSATVGSRLHRARRRLRAVLLERSGMNASAGDEV